VLPTGLPIGLPMPTVLCANAMDEPKMDELDDVEQKKWMNGKRLKNGNGLKMN
jgi:hypothetical protein